MRREIKLSVRDFATPVIRSGHWRDESDGGLLGLGVEIHAAIQNDCERQGGYRKEVFLSSIFERGDYAFHVSGRADGVFDGPRPIVEEIKSTYSLGRLEGQLADQPEHPYLLQTRTYCHLLAERGVIPRGRLRLVSSRDGEERVVDVDYSPEAYAEWLSRKLDALAALEGERERRARKRRRMAGKLVFPFPSFRHDQEKLIEAVGDCAAKGGTLLVQAPTGVGKTIGVLLPALRDALSRGAQLVYVAPKNSQFSVALETVRRLKGRGVKPSVLVLTAKSKACLREEVDCRPDACGYCENFYDKIEAEPFKRAAERRTDWSPRKTREFAEANEICPYALSLDLVERADVIIADYNYVFSPRAALLGYFSARDKSSRANLVIDEAHNLFERGMQYFSPRLSLAHLAELAESFRAEEAGGSEAAASAREGCEKLAGWVRTLRPDRPPATVSPDPEDLARFAGQTLEHLVARLQEGTGSAEPLLALYGLLADFAALLVDKRPEFLPYYFDERDGEGIGIQCLDASEHLAEAYKSFHSVVAFSATMKPFEFFRLLSGFKAKTKTLELSSGFPRENRKILVIPQISTAYRDRDRNYEKIAAVIDRVTGVEPGHYLVFFPSFAFLNAVADRMERKAGFSAEIIRQEPSMPQHRLKGFVESFTCDVGRKLVFGVQGGSLAEGVDWQGDRFKGVFVVGPGMPLFDFPRENLRKYYDAQYGDGFGFAYTCPAMIRSIQSAGRLIRSESKKGIIVFMDRRFVQEDFARIMPGDWFSESVGELVSNKILEDVSKFWEGKVPVDFQD